MNKLVKIVVIALNIIMLIFAYLWFQKKNDFEPTIVILGQLSTIIILVFEKQIVNVFIKTISDSEIEVDKNSTSHIEDVNKSKIKIK